MNKKYTSPNVLVILADEHRWDCLGACGNTAIMTPNIDALANDGMVYTNCFATFPVCTPSRYSFLTGLYVHQHLGWTNESTLPAGIKTFPRILKDAGYKTACVGKMHFMPTYANYGFDRMMLAEQAGPGRLDDDYHRYLKVRGLLDRVDLVDQVATFRARATADYFANFGTDVSNLADEHYSTTWIGDRACEEIGSWDETCANLLVAGFIKPHHPFDAPPPWSDMYDPEKLELLPGWTEQICQVDNAYGIGYFDFMRLTETSMKKILAQYYASITQIDHHVGRMIDILKDKGLYDNTLVIYTSDHGDYMGFHHLVLKSNYMYDPVIKVPLVIKFPGSKPRGLNENLVSNIDITATIIDTADCQIPQDRWHLVQPLDDESGRDVVFAEKDNGDYMVRTMNRKLLFSQKKRSQFFDLDQDPLENNDVLDDPRYETDVERMKALLFDWLAFSARSQVHVDEKGPVIEGDNVPPRDDDHRDRMNAWFHAIMDL
ncbi:MAG TPA: sulfatase-like hydrolase/transferase [Candidatus Lokiarchaeia archaeon]|nr:sulfatase-like hydrolase/transferase [Candidatus Lokiarchaeia archaeon]